MRKFYYLIGVEILLIVIISFLSSCQRKDGFDETASGLIYKIENEGSGEKPQVGEIMLLNVSYTDTQGNIDYSTEVDFPVPMRYEAKIDTIKGGMEEAISMLRVGDSLIVRMPCETLFEKTFKRPLPPNYKRGELISMNMGLVDVLDAEEFQQYQVELAAKMEARAAADREKQLEAELELLNEYFISNNIEPLEHESGLRYVVHSAGNGEYPQQGQAVSVHYAGRLVNGELFDTSIKSVAQENGSYIEGKPYQPHTFPLGRGSVIRGWDIGIALLDKGAKATLYIPSSLGYGPRGSGVIPANSVLIFDVELVSF